MDNRYHKSSKLATRRTALSLSVSGLVGITGIAGIGSASSESYAQVDIPKYKQRDTVIEYKSVPEDWYQQVKHARSVNKKVTEKYRDVPGVFGIGLGKGSETFGGKEGLQVEVEVQRPEIADQIPERVDGVPVSTTAAPETYGPGLCTNVTDDLDIFGAEAYRTPAGGGGAGSTCCRVYRNDQLEMLTCAHTFWDDCNSVSNSDITGSVVEQYDGDGDASDNIEYGEVTAAEKQADYATFDDSIESDADFKLDIDDNNGGVPVRGHVARDTLDAWQAEHIVKNMGCTTGLTEGKVTNTGYSYTLNCVDMANSGVRTYCNFGKGDSGGPTYDVSNGDAYIVSCTGYGYYKSGQCDGNPVYSDSAGVSADYIVDQGISFVDPSSV